MHSSLLARRSPSPCIVLVSRDGSRFVVPNAAATYSQVLRGALEQWAAACRPTTTHRPARHHPSQPHSGRHDKHNRPQPHRASQNDSTHELFSENEESETDGEADSSTACEIGAMQTMSTADNHTDDYVDEDNEDSNSNEEDGRWSEANRYTRRNSAQHSAGGSTCSYKSDTASADGRQAHTAGRKVKGNNNSSSSARHVSGEAETNSNNHSNTNTSNSNSSTTSTSDAGEEEGGDDETRRQVRAGSLVRRMVSVPVVDTDEEDDVDDDEEEGEEQSEGSGDESRTLSSPSEEEDNDDLSGAIVIGEAGNQMCLRSRIVRRTRSGHRARKAQKPNGTMAALSCSPNGSSCQPVLGKEKEVKDKASSPPVTTLPSETCNGITVKADKVPAAPTTASKPMPEIHADPTTLLEAITTATPLLVLSDANNNNNEDAATTSGLRSTAQRPNGLGTPHSDTEPGRGSGGSHHNGSNSSSSTTTSLANTSSSTGSTKENANSIGNLSGRRRRSLFDTEVVVVRAVDEDLLPSEAAEFVFPGPSITAAAEGNETKAVERAEPNKSASASSEVRPKRSNSKEGMAAAGTIHAASPLNNNSNGVNAEGKASPTTTQLPNSSSSNNERTRDVPPSQDDNNGRNSNNNGVSVVSEVAKGGAKDATSALPHGLTVQVPLPHARTPRAASDPRACLTPHDPLLLQDEDWNSPRSFHQRTPCMIEVDENKDELHLISGDGQERVIHTAHIAAELAQLSPALGPPSTSSAVLPSDKIDTALRLISKGSSNISNSPHEGTLTQGLDESHTRSMAGLTEQDTTVTAERADREDEMPHSRTSHDVSSGDDDEASGSHTGSEGNGQDTNTADKDETVDSETERRGLRHADGNASHDSSDDAEDEVCISTYDCAQITPRSIIIDFRVTSLTKASEASAAETSCTKAHEELSAELTTAFVKADAAAVTSSTPAESTSHVQMTKEEARNDAAAATKDKDTTGAAVVTSKDPVQSTPCVLSTIGPSVSFPRRAVRLCAEYLRRLVQAAQKSALFSYIPNSNAVAGATTLPCPLPKPLIALLLPWEVDFLYHDVLRLSPSAMEKFKRVLTVCPELDYRYSLPELRKEEVRMSLGVPTPSKVALESLTSLLKLAKQLKIDTLSALCTACLADYTLRMVYSAEDHFAAARAIRECFHVIDDYTERETEGLQIENEWPANE